MGIFDNLFGRRLADPELPTFLELSSDTYRNFTEHNEFAVIFFDAPWDTGGAKAIRPLLKSLALIYGDRVSFGEVNIDEQQDVASSVRLLNIPAIAYYRKGELAGLFVGQTQDISARIAALLDGRKVI